MNSLAPLNEFTFCSMSVTLEIGALPKSEVGNFFLLLFIQKSNDLHLKIKLPNTKHGIKSQIKNSI